MNCEQVRALKHAYADGELDALRIFELEEHLRACPNCLRVCQNLQSLRAAFRSDALFFKAPAQLKRQIQAAACPAPHKAVSRRPFSWPWFNLAIPVGITAVAALALVLSLKQPAADHRLVQEITSNHIRSLMAAHLTDVVSTDQHTVKPWFAGKLDFSPRVVDLAERGFPLVGGRLDYLENRPVASLVYERRKHVINVFVRPVATGRGEQAVEATSLHGYNLVQWRQADMNYCAVSDLSGRELLDFARAFQSVK